jgi:hypothetical protein
MNPGTDTLTRHPKNSGEFRHRTPLSRKQDSMGALADPTDGLPSHAPKFNVFFLKQLSGIEHVHPSTVPQGKSAKNLLHFANCLCLYHEWVGTTLIP